MSKELYAPDLIDESSHTFIVSFEMRITDAGRGISKEDQKKLFINFNKLADTEGINNQGTGLGLSICKNIIEKMGGYVNVESEGIEGNGATFVIQLRAISKISKQDMANNRLGRLSV